MGIKYEGYQFYLTKLSTPPNSAPTDQLDSPGEASVGGGQALESPFASMSWKDIQTGTRDLQRYADASGTSGLHDVSFVQRQEQNFTANGTDTSNSIAKTVADGLNPQPDAVGRYRIGEAIALANGMGRDTNGRFDSGAQVKVPEIDKDGKMTVTDGTKNYEIWTNGAYRESQVSDDSKGRGWDTLGKDGGREYTFQKQPDGTERRTYAGGASEVFSQDRLSGTGTTSRAEGSREYSFKINPDGSQTRTYTDNGDQQKMNADGSSVYKHIDPNNPDQSYIRFTDSNQNDNDFKIPESLSQKSIEEITKGLAIANWGDGMGDFTKNAALLNQAVSDAFSRGGDKAVQALAKEIQSRMEARYPDAQTTSFQLIPNGSGDYKVDRKVMYSEFKGITHNAGIKFNHKEFH